MFEYQSMKILMKQRLREKITEGYKVRLWYQTVEHLNIISTII